MGYQILPGLEKRRQTELEFFAVGEDFTITDCMNVRTGAAAVVMTNRNPEVDQTASGVEWLVDKYLAD